MVPSRIHLPVLTLVLVVLAGTAAVAAERRVDPRDLRPAPETAVQISNSQQQRGAAALAVSSFQVTTVIDNFASPAGYLALTLFSPLDVGATDESFAGFIVPTFDYGGMSWDTIWISSNGYIVIGSIDALDLTAVNSDFPNTARPNNVLAPFWTDLNPDAGGNVWIELLTDGFDSWTVVEWQAVPNAGNPAEANTAQVWIGWNTDFDPSEDISFAYATVTAGAGGNLTVGAENDLGSSGDTTYFNGSGTPPAPSFGGGSSACDAAWPVAPCYEVDVSTQPLDLHLDKTGTLDVAATAPVLFANPGDLINYTFEVTNLSSLPVTNVLISDPLVPTITCPSGNPIPILAAAAAQTCIGSYAITAGDIKAGQRDNTATAESDQFNAVINSHSELIPPDPRSAPALGEKGLFFSVLMLIAVAGWAWRRRTST